MEHLFFVIKYQLTKVLEDLKARAETKKLSKWLNIAITDISRIN